MIYAMTLVYTIFEVHKIFEYAFEKTFLNKLTSTFVACLLKVSFSKAMKEKNTKFVLIKTINFLKKSKKI